MKLRRLDPNTIQVPEVRVTARFTPEQWEQFQKSIEDVGVVAPVICCEVDGEFVLIDGLHRLMEAIRLKQDRVDVAVIPGDMRTVLTRNLFLDHLRGKTPITEMIKVVEALRKEFNLDSEQIAKETSMTREYIERMMILSGLTPLILEALDNGDITVGRAFTITKTKDPRLQEVLFWQQTQGKWTNEAFEEYVDGVLELRKETEVAAPQAATSSPVLLRCHYCGGEHPVEEIINPHTCRECEGTMLLALAQARQEAAQAALRAKTEGQPLKE